MEKSYVDNDVIKVYTKKGVRRMEENICKFIPQYPSTDTISTINIVYEKNCDALDKTRMSSVYIINLVTDGEGEYSFYSNKYKLKKGDIFFVFPATPYSITSHKNLKYIYISFIGIRANQIMERVMISKINPYYEGYDNLIHFWKDSLDIVNSTNIDLISESILLYTFSLICNNELTEETVDDNDDVVLKIKKYVDDHFADPHLSLEMVSSHFSYNKKYISTVFGEKLGIGFNWYLRVIRIQNACTLMEKGFTSIKDIAYMCGFNDPLYFSKVFKKIVGKTPNEHKKNLNGEK